jgi:hypothetical protein
MEEFLVILLVATLYHPQDLTPKHNKLNKVLPRQFLLDNLGRLINKVYTPIHEGKYI